MTITSPPPRPLAALCMLLALPLLTLQASAQTDPAAEANAKTQAGNTCLSTVSKFEQTISLLRDAQGKKAAAELKERLLPAKLENEILLKEGYCGLAKYLREKKLID